MKKSKFYSPTDHNRGPAGPCAPLTGGGTDRPSWAKPTGRQARYGH